jgi:hypothetical protein
LTWSYTAEIQEDMYSSNISGATRLKNGNTLICEGSSAHFYEVRLDNTIAWEYIYPTSTGSIFRSEKYELDYDAFEEKDLTPKGYIEVNPITVESTIHLPEQPTELDEVVITSKIYDDSGIVFADLYAYYENDSLIISMKDNGIDYDQIADDSIYTASIPALLGYSSVDYYIKIQDGSAEVFNDPPFASQDYAFNYEITSATPNNVNILRGVDSVTVSWDVIDGILSYNVYSSDDPYSGFEVDDSGDFTGESWTCSATEDKKFYYVKAASAK